MLILINYATSNYRRTQKFNTWTGRFIAGFDRVIECNEQFLDEEFKCQNKNILSKKNGMFVWKPYCILKVLQEINDGDILFYCDSGAFFIKNIRSYLEENVNDVWVSDIPFLEKQFSNHKAFEIIGCDEKVYGDYNQIQAGFIGIRKNDKTVKIVEEWLRYCCNEDIMISSVEGNDDTFIENRDDQTALSLLCKREGIVPYPDPTQYGKIPELYMRDIRFLFVIPKMYHSRVLFLILHRTPNVNFMICIKQILSVMLPKTISVKLIETIRKQSLKKAR